MNRWSVSRTFRNVTSQDFLDAIISVRDNFQEACGCAVAVEIKLYDGMKHSITSIQDGLNEWLAEQNARKVFETITDIEKFTDDSWLKAVFVEATLRPEDPEAAPRYAFAHIEGKGTRPKQLCFYVQPAEAGDSVQRASLERFRGWRVGDGYNSNHSVSYS